MEKKQKGWGWFGLAFLTCPCHLVLIIPLLAGTALGTYLTDHKLATIVILGITFALSLYMGFKRMNLQDKTN
jgi:mercuric ion transport protein